jgi:glycosyltransferase involved in cell wall biosynthesis
MQILYSAPDVEIPGTHGGSAHVTEVINSLLKSKNRVYLICRKEKNRKVNEKSKGLELIRIPIFFKSGFFKTLNYFLFTFIISFYLCLFKKVDTVYERGRIFGGAATLVGWVFRKPSIYELNEPVIYVPILTGMNENSITYKLLRFWHYFTVKKATVITATHKSALAGLPEKKCIVISYGANPDKFNPDTETKDIKEKYGLIDKKAVLYIGSFRPWHQCENIIHTAREVVKQNNKTRFMMIGKGEKFNECKKLVEEFNLQNNVILLGEVSYEEIPAYVNASDICLALFDQNYEPFQKFGYYYSPIKVHEYKACGKPVVASDMGNLRELVKNGKNGLLVDSTKISEISDAILYLIQHEKIARHMGKTNRREVIEEYNWDKINEEILRELRKRIQSGG